MTYVYIYIDIIVYQILYLMSIHFTLHTIIYYLLPHHVHPHDGDINLFELDSQSN
jgi:hypothetical protein